jgi:hypothetical protein
MTIMAVAIFVVLTLCLCAIQVAAVSIATALIAAGVFALARCHGCPQVLGNCV